MREGQVSVEQLFRYCGENPTFLLVRQIWENDGSYRQCISGQGAALCYSLDLTFCEGFLGEGCWKFKFSMVPGCIGSPEVCCWQLDRNIYPHVDTRCNLVDLYCSAGDHHKTNTYSTVGYHYCCCFSVCAGCPGNTCLCTCVTCFSFGLGYFR